MSTASYHGPFVTLLATSLLTLAAASCDQGRPESTEPEPPRVRIFLVGEGQSESSWPVLQAAAERFQRDDPGVGVKAVAPVKASPIEQQKLIESLLLENASAVCVLPADATSIRPGIRKLVTSGCPVVTIGRDVPNSNRTTHCGPSEIELGRAAAEACALALSGRPQTVMTLRADAENSAYQARSHSFREELPRFGSILLLKEVECDDNMFDAANIVRREAQNFPRTGCWVLFDDWPLRATPDTERLLPLGCRIVLCNGNPKYINRVKAGEIQALVTYDLFEAIQGALMAAREGVDNPSRDQTGAVTVETITISVSELEWYNRCWESWKRGQPSPRQTPWE